MDKLEERVEKPCGLDERDSIEGALQRADGLAGSDWHSGQLCTNKDLRRIVLFAYEYRKIEAALKESQAKVATMRWRSVEDELPESTIKEIRCSRLGYKAWETLEFTGGEMDVDHHDAYIDDVVTLYRIEDTDNDGVAWVSVDGNFYYENLFEKIEGETMESLIEDFELKIGGKESCVHITHWMPLPEAPLSATGGNDE